MIMFTCHGCNVVDRKVPVRERIPTETIISWMEDVRVAVSDAHSIVSPKCTCKVSDIKIPYFEGQPVGTRKME